jgi:hypothetical protein
MPTKKPVRRRNHSSNITPALIARIAEMTDRNDHTGSVIELSRALRNERTTKALRAIDALHEFYGHMPSDLRMMRDGIHEGLLKVAKRETDAETYRRLHGAF